MAKPTGKALGKRKVGGQQPPKPGNKKAKTSSNPGKEVELGPSGKPKRRPDQPKKIKLRDQKTIPVPRTAFAGDSDEDEDSDVMDLGEEEGFEILAGAGNFLSSVDQGALSRSVKETKRLHELSKAREPLPGKRKQRASSVASVSTIEDYALDSGSDFDSDLQSDEEMDSGFDSAGPSGSGSGSELEESDQEGLNAGYDVGTDEESLEEEDEEDDDKEDKKTRRQSKKAGKTAQQAEADYEQAGRARWTTKAKPEEDHVEVGRLPIKLPTGEVQIVKGTTRVALPPSKKKVQPESESEEEEDDEDEEASDDNAEAEVMAGLKGRFGKLGVAEIVGNVGWKNQQRLAAAKEQIAAIGAEILAGGELIDIGPVLTRLSTFALPTVPSMNDGGEPLAVPNSIRGLAFLSQLAVYKDLIPGYRIRELTALEQAEKVRDEVRRLREGEKLLVKSYKGYLKTLEAEIKRRTPLATLSLKCMCDLLASVPHFNFSENIMGVLVGRLGRKSWDDDSDQVLQTFITVFKNDISAQHSQTLVRLLARMIKEKKFQVHPNTLSCLLCLRLKTELGAMRDGKKGKGRADKSNGIGEKKFKSEIRKQWQTKNQRKREKELKEVEKEMAEAEAEVDQEERAQIQTETLKNLFVLYFSILKSPIRSPLLPAALEGISRFAHLVNIDFFRDLLAVLRKVISDQYEDDEDDQGIASDPVGAGMRVRIRLLGIVTAFDLLSGQGEALNIDLGDFINQLFVLLRPLSMDTSIEDPPILTTSTLRPANTRPLQIGRTPSKSIPTVQSTSTLLFRCLHSIFFSKHITTISSPPWRAAAFAKRLLECSLHFPPETARLSVGFVRQLMSKEPRLEAMLDSEERTFDGVYKAEIDDPQLVNAFNTSFWELDGIAERHMDRLVRKEAVLLRDGKLV